MALFWLKNLESGTRDGQLPKQGHQVGIYECLFVLRVERDITGPKVAGRGVSVERNASQEQKAKVSGLPLPFICFMALDKSFPLSGPQFSYLPDNGIGLGDLGGPRKS